MHRYRKQLLGAVFVPHAVNIITSIVFTDISTLYTVFVTGSFMTLSMQNVFSYLFYSSLLSDALVPSCTAVLCAAPRYASLGRSFSQHGCWFFFQDGVCLEQNVSPVYPQEFWITSIPKCAIWRFTDPPIGCFKAQYSG